MRAAYQSKIKSKQIDIFIRKGMEMQMKRRVVLCRLSKSFAAITAAACTAIMSCVGYYGHALPDRLTTAYDSKLTFNTLLQITADELSTGKTAYSASSSGGMVTTRDISLKLFGSVPIKDVKEETVDRPVVAVGGYAFGIKLVTDGVMIIDMKNLSGCCPAKDAGLRIGDVIEEINGEQVTSNSQVSEIIKNSGGEECSIIYRRDGVERECTLTPILSQGSYCAGMWVRDSSAGIGIVTFSDPQTGVFAGLGHAICDVDTGEALPLSNGSVSEVRINGIAKSEKGQPGQIMGEFVGGNEGELVTNCDGGVYGILDEYTDFSGELYPLGFASEVHEGDAYILAQIDNGEPQRFDISIESILSSDSEHDLIIKVTDEELIEKTGGIVQGMSGSPIIQDGRLVGAVTHVFVDDPTGGYGIFAESMYEYSTDIISVSREEKIAG